MHTDVLVAGSYGRHALDKEAAFALRLEILERALVLRIFVYDKWSVHYPI